MMCQKLQYDDKIIADFPRIGGTFSISQSIYFCQELCRCCIFSLREIDCDLDAEGRVCLRYQHYITIINSQQLWGCCHEYIMVSSKSKLADFRAEAIFISWERNEFLRDRYTADNMIPIKITSQLFWHAFYKH